MGNATMYTRDNSIAGEPFSAYIPTSSSNIGGEIRRHGGTAQLGSSRSAVDVTSDYVRNGDVASVRQSGVQSEAAREKGDWGDLFFECKKRIQIQI